MKEKEQEFDRFTRMTDGLLSVPHSEIKQKLEQEKRTKKRKKARASSASREASDR